MDARFSTLGGVGLLGAALCLAAPSAKAQDAAGSWLAWIGCWDAVEDVESRLLCVRPLTDRSGVEILDVEEGEVASVHEIRTDGAEHPFELEGCSGIERAEFSSDGQRVYLSSDYMCEGGVRRTSTGLLAMASRTEWLDLHGVEVGGEKAVRAARYTLASQDEVEAAGMAGIGTGRSMAVAATRMVAARPPDLDDVIEVANRVDPEVTAAWLIETGERFRLDADEILRMADSGVPEQVIDVAVAVSFPGSFAVEADSRRVEAREASRAVASRGYWGYGDPFRDPYFYRRYSGRYGLLYSPFGYGGGFGRYYPSYGPTIVYVGSGGEEASRGRVVKGRGYTRPRSEAGGSTSSGTPDSGAGPPSASARSGSGPSDPPASSGRRAKRRPRGA